VKPNPDKPEKIATKAPRHKKIRVFYTLKISGPQQRWPRPLPGAILIPPALLVVADFVSGGENILLEKSLADMIGFE